MSITENTFIDQKETFDNGASDELTRIFNTFRQLAKHNMRPGAVLQSFNLMVWSDAEIFIERNGEFIAKTKDEAELMRILESELQK